MPSDNDSKPDENEGVADGGVPGSDTDVGPVRVPVSPPFTVPPPPPLTSRPVPLVQPVPESTIPAEPPTPIAPLQSPPSSLPPRSSEERSDSSADKESGFPPPLPPGRPSGVPPPPPSAPRPIPSQPRAEPREVSPSHSPPQSRVIRTASDESQEYEEDLSTMSFDLPGYAGITSQSQDKAGQSDPSEQEILADEDGGILFLPSSVMRSSLPTRRPHRSRLHSSEIPLYHISETACGSFKTPTRGARSRISTR